MEIDIRNVMGGGGFGGSKLRDEFRICSHEIYIAKSIGCIIGVWKRISHYAVRFAYGGRKKEKKHPFRKKLPVLLK